MRDTIVVLFCPPIDPAGDAGISPRIAVDDGLGAPFLCDDVGRDVDREAVRFDVDSALCVPALDPLNLASAWEIWSRRRVLGFLSRLDFRVPDWVDVSCDFRSSSDKLVRSESELKAE